MEGSTNVNLQSFVDESNKSLQNYAEVEKGVMHIIASVVASDTEVLSLTREL